MGISRLCYHGFIKVGSVRSFFFIRHRDSLLWDMRVSGSCAGISRNVEGIFFFNGNLQHTH